MSLVASGSVDDYQNSTAELKIKVARLAGVDPEWVVIEVSPGSVIITATIAVPPYTTAEVVRSSLSSSLPTTATASAELGVTAEQIPTVVVAAPPPSPPTPTPPPTVPPPPSAVAAPSPPSPHSEANQSAQGGVSASMMPGMPIVITAAGAVLVLAASGAAAGYRRMNRKKQPPSDAVQVTVQGKTEPPDAFAKIVQIAC